MGAGDRPGADGDRADHDLVRVEVGEPGTDRDHVRDRVERADLVEGDVQRVAPVHRGLGHGQPFEGGDGAVAHGAVEVGGEQQRPDVAPGAVVHRVGDVDVAARRGEPVAGHRLDP